ncbi:MAG TPA: hypothetical protein DD640_07905 [Clostridiales bacterium]|nr:hypothetical protein [Clostridiales bacterium]
MNIVAIGCHPDDLEIGCGGTLRRYADAGAQVTMVLVANGNMGHARIMPDELRAIRRQESEQAAQILGAEIVQLDVPDLSVDSGNSALSARLTDVIRARNPDLIITHSPDDYMRDHAEVSHLVFDAGFNTSVPHYASEPASPIAALYYMDTLAGVNFLPEEYVDITSEIEKKIDALEQHVSQLKWMRDHDGIDFAEFVRTCSRFRGLQCGCGYAEGFRVCRAWPRMRARRLLP